jgi:uncharacterized small protein (DUF1192 family)
MIDEPNIPRQARGAQLDALSREDLDLYSVEELGERITRLEAEIARSAAARAKKTAGRAAADALFGRRADPD